MTSLKTTKVITQKPFNAEVDEKLDFVREWIYGSTVELRKVGRLKPVSSFAATTMKRSKLHTRKSWLLSNRGETSKFAGSKQSIIERNVRNIEKAQKNVAQKLLRKSF